MRTSIAAVTALAGSLLLAPLMLGPTQAGGAPDLKNALSATRDSAVTLVRGGGGGGGGHGGFAMGGGHMRGGHEFVGGGGPRFAAHDFHHGFNHDHFHHFHNRRFFVSNVFFFGGYPYYGYYGDCYWLKRKAIITGSPYWWTRYEACLGYY